MCGISCICSANEGLLESLDFNGLCASQALMTRLANRGPDRSSQCRVKLTARCTASFTGHVLHLRGDQVATQPAEDDKGNCLLWNGEIFNGIKVPENTSDTDILLEKLKCCQSDEAIVATMSQIQGPWAFIYLQHSSKTLWFGRDVLGRRSLLWHLPCDETDVFCLSSVQIKPLDFTEVPSVGLYKMATIEHESHQSYDFKLYPWQHAVWPGTLERLVDDETVEDKLTAGQHGVVTNVKFELCKNMEVPSQLPTLNKTTPPSDYSILPLQPQQSHIQYLQSMLERDGLMKTLCTQLADVLLQAVKTRVFNQPKYKMSPILQVVNSKDPDDVQCKLSCNEVSAGVKCDSQSNSSCKLESKMEDLELLDVGGQVCPDTEMGSKGSRLTQKCTEVTGSTQTLISSAHVAILFSGGIDSTVIAALADKCVPAGESIDLLNVAFEQRQKAPPQHKHNRHVAPIPACEKWQVPDRVTGYTALSELNPQREWNFIEVNVTADELQEARHAHIHELIYPLRTVLDDSIGCAVWFAARGHGVLGNGPNKGCRMNSQAKVILCGMGADEQLVGYSRHRNKFKDGDWSSLIKEIELEVKRISARNLGRDDRIITDHGKESRFPFLDEQVVQFLSTLPLHHKADLTLPRGLGEKLLLRLCAAQLGLLQTATLAKRAIQFGSRIAKLENSKEKATDQCDRLMKPAAS